MQTAVKRKPTEAEIRRADFKVYDGAARAVKKQRRLRFRLRAQALLMVTGIFLMSMAYMFLSAQITMLGYEINRQMAINDELAADNARIMLDIEIATSPEKVNAYAEEHLNMVVASEDSVVYYQKGAAPVQQASASGGMAVDAAALGYGSVEVLEQAKENKLVEAFGSLWRMLRGKDNVQVGMN